MAGLWLAVTPEQLFGLRPEISLETVEVGLFEASQFQKAQPSASPRRVSSHSFAPSGLPGMAPPLSTRSVLTRPSWPVRGGDPVELAVLGTFAAEISIGVVGLAGLIGPTVMTIKV